MIYYKAQYQQDQFAHKNNWIDLHPHTNESLEETYKELLHFVLKSESDSYIRCRVIKVVEEQVYYDERLEKEFYSAYVD